jgi:hypothetical protein
VFVLHGHFASKHDRDLAEFGPLTRFDPAWWRSHACDADHGIARGWLANEFLDDLRLVAHRLNYRRVRYEPRHRFLFSTGSGDQ